MDGTHLDPSPISRLNFLFSGTISSRLNPLFSGTIRKRSPSLQHGMTTTHARRRPQCHKDYKPCLIPVNLKIKGGGGGLGW